MGEPIFTGRSNTYWQYETFDLSDFEGAIVVFRLDFGADGDVNYAGWYVDDFAVYGGGFVDYGYIDGTVDDLTSGDPINGAVVSSGVVTDTTGVDGSYSLPLIPGTYSVTAAAEYHNPITVGPRQSDPAVGQQLFEINPGNWR